jgi:hypothetical protein
MTQIAMGMLLVALVLEAIDPNRNVREEVLPPASEA